MSNIELNNYIYNNFQDYVFGVLFCIEGISLIRDKYKQIKHLGVKYKEVDDAISVFHRVSNESHDLCIEFIKKIIIEIEKSKQMCLDEFSSNTNYKLEERKEIYNSISIMDNLKLKLDKISPLDFIIEVQNAKDNEDNEDNEDEECEIGPYDYLDESDKYSHYMISNDYDGYNGYDN